VAGDVEVEVSYAARKPWVPARARFRMWAHTALRELGASGVVSVRVVGSARSRSLNGRYRGKHQPTNVLSFAGPGLAPDGANYLGELVICAPVVAREARAQGKPRESHWAHMTVHGVMHLLGFDHELAKEADEMASREVQILDRLGFADPYA
jgi:probable rRNA maturation factor